MHVAQVLSVLGLLSVASAVDIVLDSGGCYSGGYACVGTNPNVCCSNGKTFNSATIKGNMNKWRLELRVYTGGRCSNLKGGWYTGGNTEICATVSGTSGAGYNFVGKKARREALTGCAVTETEGCTSSMAPNAFVLRDGTTYSLRGMSAEQVEELENLHKRGEDIPSSFDLHRMAL